MPRLANVLEVTLYKPPESEASRRDEACPEKDPGLGFGISIPPDPSGGLGSAHDVGDEGVHLAHVAP